MVILAGNLLIHIEGDTEYAQAQKLLIQKATQSLKNGAHLYLDFDLHFDPLAVFHSLEEHHYFQGTDELGTAGRSVSYGSVYDPVTQICTGVKHLELKTSNGETLWYPQRWYKHIPTQKQVYGWLSGAGFVVEQTYRNFTEQPEPVDPQTYRGTVWARKKKMA